MSFIKATKLIRTECGWSIAIGGRKKTGWFLAAYVIAERTYHARSFIYNL